MQPVNVRRIEVVLYDVSPVDVVVKCRVHVQGLFSLPLGRQQARVCLEDVAAPHPDHAVMLSHGVVSGTQGSARRCLRGLCSFLLDLGLHFEGHRGHVRALSVLSERPSVVEAREFALLVHLPHG